MNLRRFWWLPAGKAPEISPREFDGWLKSGKTLQVVDARTALEYQQGTIGAAQHAPLTEMPYSMEKLALDPDHTVVVLCLTGHRSLPGTRWLRSKGYQAYSLQGGITAWKRAGLPLDKPVTQ